MSARCSLCGHTIAQKTPYYRRCAGWERKAAGQARKGGSDIVLREPLDELACWGCIDSLKNGRSPGQGGLL